MNDSILIARAGNELGTWNAAEVRRMLESGVLMPGDNYWTTGMAEWDTLDRFVSIEPAAPKTYPIRFGSAWAVDKLGFTRSGTISVSATGLEIRGPRQWSAIIRVIAFLVLTPILWWLFGSIASVFHGEGVGLNLFGAILGLFTLIGAPMLALMVTGSFCASPDSIKLAKGAISDIERSGTRISFQVALSPGKPRRALFRTGSAPDAAALVRLIQV